LRDFQKRPKKFKIQKFQQKKEINPILKTSLILNYLYLNISKNPPHFLYSFLAASSSAFYYSTNFLASSIALPHNY